ncbi:MAG TPA: hypothetical protein VGN12_16875 [Pirellulales bacterium]|jgi:hypothetical protein
MMLLRLTQGMFTKVDARWFDHLSQFRWQYHRSSGGYESMVALVIWVTSTM